jgi:tRNA(fMet)-specific endonuclease VapC
MSFLIDTDVCSAHLRNVGSRFLQYTGQLHISVLTLGELLSWTLRARTSRKYHQALLNMLQDVTVIDVDQAVANRFGVVRARLLDQGQPVAATDLMIGATALVHSLTMVTHNMAHLSKIPGLTLDDWLVP